MTLRFYEPVVKDLEEVQERLRRLAQEVDDPRLTPLFAHPLEVPGKRVRPTITLLAGRLTSQNPDKIILMATAVELLHIATLVHDDTVDNAALRRGRATLSKLFGPQVAVLVGDYLFAASAVLVCQTGHLGVVQRFAETIMDLASGELEEHLSRGIPTQTRDQYYRRIYRKTASLFRTAAESGAILCGAPEAWVEAMRRYGYALGMAFQIVDDILDVDGVGEEVGKPVGNDLREGVLTLPALLLLERFPQGNPILSLLRGEDTEANLTRALEMLRTSGVLQEAMQVARGFLRQAEEALAPLPPSDSKECLLALADYVVGRRK
ncbi:MAG: polyprenyl synthetase family protein [Dehalococcoidia bacterium]|nr:polyprenyl synthetase family protein [Dehalococcoidia bacterium]MDW8120154.1 polyprenyl synthetase family protein [Chloroflexota bacterium]